MIKNFDEILERVRGFDREANIAVAAAEDEHTLEACLRAERDKLIDPIFIGDKEKISDILKGLDAEPNDYQIYGTDSKEESAQVSVNLIREGKADMIMKGMLDTNILLKAVVNKEDGIKTDRLMTHLAFMQIPTYHKLLIITDGGMVTYPDLDAKIEIVKNGVEILNALGYEEPKVACIAAVEKANERMPETMDALKIKQMNMDGKIKNCIVEGPISFDLIFDRESCILKDYDSPVGGDADIILVPDFVVGNALAKSFIYAAGGQMAGFIAGAKVPIILTSRSSSSREKYLSTALAALVSREMG